jgi:hypothetical protein
MVFGIIPECCSASSRNGVRLPSGTLFGFAGMRSGARDSPFALHAHPCSDSGGFRLACERKRKTLRSNESMDNTRVFRTAFASVYPHYITKTEKNGRTKKEVHAIIHRLTGYDEQALQQQIDKKVDFETFFARAPRINPNVSKITGAICGYRVEEIEDKLMQQIRYLDKLVDELARGKAMDKILRK